MIRFSSNMAKQVFFKVYLSNSIKTLAKVFDGNPISISEVKRHVLEDIGCENENADDFSLLNLTAEHAPVSGQFVFQDKNVFIMSKSRLSVIYQLHAACRHHWPSMISPAVICGI